MINKIMEQQVFFEHQDLINKYTSELQTEIKYNRSFINSLIKRTSEITKELTEVNIKLKSYESYILFIKWKLHLPWYKRIFVSENKLFNEFNKLTNHGE